MSLHLPPLGTRLRLGEHTGTVRFVGEVSGSKGTWLGVEWDDQKRGKHDGTKDGVRYFTCSVPGSGSFVRPTPSLSYGRPFLAALKAKYVEALQGGNEMVVLGSSNGAIEVEAVNLDIIRRNLASLENLRAVSLDDVASAKSPGDIAKNCPNIASLDISFSLVSSWDTIISICKELPRLERLGLNHTRLQPPPNNGRISHVFLKLEELSLNGTNMTWSSIMSLIKHMPRLNYLEAGVNGLEQLNIDPSESSQNESNNLETINLDSNKLGDWVDVCRSLQCLPGLRRLILHSNRFGQIPLVDTSLAQYKLKKVDNIVLTSNSIGSWADVDNLAAWLPSLSSIRLRDNPLLSDTLFGIHYWQFAVARLPSLEELDGTRISPKERRDCELFYINWIAREGPASEDEKQREHPRWVALCEKWGRPDEVTSAPQSQNKLSSQLIQLIIHHLPHPPSAGSYATVAAVDSPPPTTLKILRTMSLRTFRMKILKTFKAPRGAKARLWLSMADNSLAEVDVGQDDTGDLTWWGLEDGAQVFLFVDS